MLTDLFDQVAAFAGKHGGNVRFVRSVVERLKMRQGRRLLVNGFGDRDEMLQINEDDAKKLLADSDVNRRLRGREKKAVGFR